MPLTCWVMPIPHTRQEPANGGRAYQRAAWAMSRFGTPVTRSACSSVNGASDCRQVSNPSVRAWTKSRLARPSAGITFAIELKSVTSVPGRWAIQRSAWLTSSMRLGLMTTIRAPEANRDDGMIRGGVGAHDHDAAGLLVVDVRVRRGARAHRDEHRLHRRGVTEARAVIDVVRAHHDAHELLDDVAVLVGRLGAGQRTEPAMMPCEPVGGEVERLVPRGLAPAAVDLHERRRDAIA